MVSTWIVRHGSMRFLGEFDPEGQAFARGEDVIVRTERGHEVGQVLCRAEPRALQMLSEPTHGRIVRRMSERDRQEWARIADLERAELETCDRFVEQRKLLMDLVDV